MNSSFVIKIIFGEYYQGYVMYIVLKELLNIGRIFLSALWVQKLITFYHIARRLIAGYGWLLKHRSRICINSFI